MSDENIDTSIGGNAEERTQRGFAIYGRIVDSHGNVTRVQRSSAMGGPYCHVFTKDGDGRDVVPCVGARGNVLSVSPHLDATQARALAALLTGWGLRAERVERVTRGVTAVEVWTVGVVGEVDGAA